MFCVTLLMTAVPLSIVSQSVRSETQAGLLRKKEPMSAHVAKIRILTNKSRYSLRESVELDVAIRNEGDSPIYLDRRMFWGYGGGLHLDIRDQQGTSIGPSVRDDAIMPPPSQDDPLPLVRIDEWHFFGTTRLLPIQEYFFKPGKYVLRVKYTSWLDRDDLIPRLRDLPGPRKGDPSIVSEPVWIEISK